MKIDEIRELVSLLEQSELNVLEVSEGESRIRLEKAAAPAIPAGMTIPVQTMAAAMPLGGVPAALAAGAAGLEAGTAAPGAEGAGATCGAEPAGKAVRSPMVGVFYGRPSPGEEPFISVGSRVEKGDVVCIVEAMKLMNEITAEVGGVVTEICAADGDVVEYGQPLFYLK